ncbi:MAG: RagB/SusD family nutrient uptake outer membrane protein [Prevotella sp.]|nr:RagB/SusD family nutrient uptake outer membrane protein [Prevotella sp.]
MTMKLLGAAFFILHSSFFISCSDFLYDDSDQVAYADRNLLTEDADTLWAVAGIMNKMQVIADRTILLGEVRGDLVSLTNDASADLRALANFESAVNKYNRPSDYYAIINNCNYYLANADTTLRNSRNERVFLKEYAAVKAFRAWTYLQLVLNYGSVPLVTKPILSLDDAGRYMGVSPEYIASEKLGLPEGTFAEISTICKFFIADLLPFADVEMPTYGSIRSTDSKLFYYPIKVLLGDLYLWSGQYREAAQSYYRYISTRNGTNSVYPISTNSVRFTGNDSRWMNTRDSWSPMFAQESNSSNSELIMMIPGDSIPSEGNYSELRDLFNTSESNDYTCSIVPSQALIDLSAAQKYCHYTSGGEYVYAPDGLDNYRTGDLRLSAVYTNLENLGGLGVSVNGKRVTNYSVISKYQTRNVHILRRAMVWLRLAEALNRAGFPRFAFQILKTGVNNNVIANEVLPYYPADSAFIASFYFPNTSYLPETTARLATENTMGIHSRGSGYTAANAAYAFLEDSTITDTPQTSVLDAQIDYVENLITDEEALEFAFEGHRFYDLMRIALRRNDPSYLASRVARRSGTLNPALNATLSDTRNWYLRLE